MHRISLPILLVVTLLMVVASGYCQPVQEVSILNYINNYNVGRIPMGTQSAFMKSAYLKDKDEPEPEIANPALNKMGEGVVNSTTFWTEIPKEMATTSQEHNILIGATLGFGKGVVMGLARGVSGAFDTATFALPPYDKPMMNPDYAVKSPQNGFKVDILEW